MSKTKLFFWRTGYFQAISGLSPLAGREKRVLWPRWMREAFAKGWMEGQEARYDNR